MDLKAEIDASGNVQERKRMSAYIPETLNMAPVFVYNIMGERVAYSCKDIRAELRRLDAEGAYPRYRHGDAFIIAQPRRLHELTFNDLGAATEEVFETMTLRVREFRHGRHSARQLAGEFQSKADEERYLHWYPELAPDWTQADD